MREVDDEGRILCPECGERAPQRYEDKTIRDTNTVFAGSQTRSIAEGFHRSSVGEARQLFGDAGNCIRDDGSVHFGDRREQRNFAKRKEQILEQARAKRRAKGQHVEEVL